MGREPKPPKPRPHDYAVHMCHGFPSPSPPRPGIRGRERQGLQRCMHLPLGVALRRGAEGASHHPPPHAASLIACSVMQSRCRG